MWEYDGQFLLFSAESYYKNKKDTLRLEQDILLAQMGSNTLLRTLCLQQAIQIDRVPSQDTWRVKKPITSVPHIETPKSCEVAVLIENEVGDTWLS